LRNRVVGRRLERPAPCVLRRLERRESPAAFGGQLRMASAQVAVVFRPYVAALVFRDVASLENPCPTEGRQPPFHIAIESWVAPRSARVIDPDRLIDLDGSVERFCGCEVDLAHGHADVGVDFSLDVYAAGIRQWLAAVGFDGAFRCDHSEF
jgi:hypothetical protein